MRCAHLENPLAIAPDRVRFGWLLSGDGLQQAYQVQVRAVPETQNAGGWLPGVPVSWDSGPTQSGDSADVAYAGPPLARGARYEWRVRVWDAAGTASPWSEPAAFEVELGPGDWAASWIGLGPVREDFAPPSQPGRPDAVASALRPAPHLRRSFTVAGPVAAARLHVTALGLYEARLNGHRVGDAYLTPGWTDYDQRVLYQSYDVTGPGPGGRERARRDPRATAGTAGSSGSTPSAPARTTARRPNCSPSSTSPWPTAPRCGW